MPDRFSIPVIRDTVLGVRVFRGYARLCDLSQVSRADIYDAKTNPTGTQRDLSPKHAREAYIYVRNEKLAFWPEIFLCARDSTVLSFSEKSSEDGFGILTIDVSRIRNLRDIAISRVDGNHRLHYASGEFEGYPPIERRVSFCLAFDLSLEQEIKLFRDINNNQRRMNTSHLDNIKIRLTEEELLKRKEPELYIAQELSKDPDSPLYSLVHEGGQRVAGTFIPLRTLKTGIGYMLSRPTRLTALDDPDAQYRVVKNYFKAVQKWIPDAWKNPREYVALRGAGLWGICFIGAEVIDRALAQGKFKDDDMLKILSSGRKWDWTNKGDFKGFSGRGGAVAIRDKVVSEFEDEGGVSVKELFRQIMDE